MDANITFVGTINPIKETESFKCHDVKEYDSGWMSTTTNLNMVCGDDRHLVSIKGGVMTKNGKVDPSAKIYTFSKGGEDENGNKIKGERMEVLFKDRMKPEIIDSVAGFKHYVLDTEEYGRRASLQKIVDGYKSGEVDATLVDELGIKDESDAKSKLEESIAKKKVFLTPLDLSKAVYEHFKDGTDKNLYVVKGSIEIQYNANKDVEYKTYVPQKIYRAKDGAEPESTVTMEFYFDENALDKSDWDETKVAVVTGYQRYYYTDKSRGIKGEFACETSFKIDGNKYEKAEGLIKKMSKSFDSDKPYKKMTVKLHARDGAEREELKYEDLTDDQKEDIDLGLATLEDYQNALGSAYGESVREYILKEVVISDGAMIVDTEFTDMSKPHADEELDELELPF